MVYALHIVRYDTVNLSCALHYMRPQVENSRMVSLAWEQLEQSLLSQENVNKHYSSDRYNITSYNSMKNSDRNNLHSGLNQAMLADLTHDEDDDADCISV